MTTQSSQPAVQIPIPFAAFVGLELHSADASGSVVRLPERAELTNHVGSQHAGALFTVAETASGIAAYNLFSDVFGKAIPLVKQASIQYAKIAKGPITASGTVRASRDEVLATLARDGKAEFFVDVSMADENDEVVALMEVQWHLRALAG